MKIKLKDERFIFIDLLYKVLYYFELHKLHLQFGFGVHIYFPHLLCYWLWHECRNMSVVQSWVTYFLDALILKTEAFTILIPVRSLFIQINKLLRFYIVRVVYFPSFPVCCTVLFKTKLISWQRFVTFQSKWSPISFIFFLNLGDHVLWNKRNWTVC